MGPGGNFSDRQSMLGTIEAFLWDNVMFRRTLDDPIKTIDAFEAPWSDPRPESQLDFYGDVRLEFLSHEHRLLGECIVPGKCIDAENWANIVSPGVSTGVNISLIQTDHSRPNMYLLGGTEASC